MLTKSQLELLARFEDDYTHVESDEELWALLGQVDSAVQLHYLPLILNWDSGWTEKIVEWILKHPLCDAGTALSIYWLMEPQFWKKQELTGNIQTWARNGYSLHQKCEELYKSGKYSEGVIFFNPRDGTYLPEDPVEDSSIERLIPDRLKQPTPGMEVPEYYSLK